MFGLVFLQYCVNGHQVGQVDSSSLTTEISLCRPLMPYYLVLDALGESHRVLLVCVRVCIQT